MRADVVALLRCPHCAGPLTDAGGALRCPQGHSFDLARQGYVSLLAAGAGTGTADTAAMVQAREQFLGRGHYAGLADLLAGTAREAAPEDSPGAVVDVGAGTGYYLARVLDALQPRPGLALDLSRYAVRRAARAHPRAGAAVADAWRTLPVADAVADVVMSVFAPRNPAEVARVLRPAGVLVVATPEPDHLRELVGALGLLGVQARKRERLAAAHSGTFEVERAVRWRHRLSLPVSDVAALAGMGPSAHHTDAERLRRDAAALPDPVDVTAAVTVTVFRRR